MTLGEIAALVSGDLHGPADMPITGPVEAETEEPGGIAFAESEEYLEKAERSQAAALLLPRSLTSKDKPFIHVDQVRASFLRILQSAVRPLPLEQGVHPTAVVHPSAELAAGVQVGPYAVVERNAKIEQGCRIYPFAYIGEDCVLREDCVVYPHAVLYQSVELGKRTVVHAGAILGADGFGYIWTGAKRLKMPQIGSVQIGPDCEIGALTAIDRATMGQTRIGQGAKIDNLCQIAHNVHLGDHAALASQVGIAGSSTLGDRVVMGGQSGVADHIEVADDVVLAARAGAIENLEEPGEYLGFPARPMAHAKRSMLLALKLPELFSRLRRIERRLGE